MKVSPSKENILKKIRQALSNTVPVPFPQNEGTGNVFQPSQQELEVEFAENFSKLQGRFSFCANEEELAGQLSALMKARNWEKIYCQDEAIKATLAAKGFASIHAKDLYSCDASITDCEKLVARTGSIVMSSGQQSGRTTSVYAPVHICIAYTDQLVYDIKEALQYVKDGYATFPTMVTLATGPSRTADIEKTLVVGVHGPKEVFCFLVERGVNCQ